MELKGRTRGVLQACPTGSVKDRPELRPLDCPSPLHLALSLSLSLLPRLGWLSGAEEIDKQVERLKSPAQEADVTLLRAQ